MKQVSWGVVKPEWLFFVFWSAGVLLPIIPFLSETDGFSILWDYTFRDKATAIELALIIYTLVLLLFVLGAKIGFFATANRFSVKTIVDGEKSFSVFKLRAVVITLIAMASLIIVTILLGGIDSLLEAGGDRIRKFAGLNFLVLLQNGLLSVSLAWLIKLSGSVVRFRLWQYKWFLFYSFCAFAIVALQGAKSTLFVYLVAVIVIWHVRIRQFRITELVLIGTFLFVFLMAYHVFKQEYLIVGEFVFYDRNAGFLSSVSNLLFQQLTGNLMQLQCLSVLIDAMPQYLPFQYGETLKMVFLIWIPAALFPDKPLTAPGVFTSALWPLKLSDEATTMPPGLFGEFYMNFGWAGALIGAILFGLVYGFFYGRAVRQPASNKALGCYALLAGVMLHYFRGELASVTVLLLSMLVPLIWLLKESRKH